MRQQAAKRQQAGKFVQLCRDKLEIGKTIVLFFSIKKNSEYFLWRLFIT